MLSLPIYHVTRDWDGGDLLSLVERSPWSDEVAAEIEARWPDADPWHYYNTDGHYVHCLRTVDEAIAWRDEWCPGGQILQIKTDELEVGTDSIEIEAIPHPTVRDRIEARCITLRTDLSEATADDAAPLPSSDPGSAGEQTTGGGRRITHDNKTRS